MQLSCNIRTGVGLQSFVPKTYHVNFHEFMDTFLLILVQFSSLVSCISVKLCMAITVLNVTVINEFKLWILGRSYQFGCSLV